MSASTTTFTNLYYKRTAGTPKACYVCSKPTTTVLATISTVDFIYTCPTHLTDTGFASPFVDPEAAKPPALSQEDIGKVIAEWEDRQKRKKEKEEKEKKEKAAKDKDSKDKESKDSKDSKESKDSKDTDDPPPKFPGSLSPKAALSPTHERFTLHRDMFAMRLRDHRKRRQTAQAKDLAPRLPGAPRGTL
ncbi:VPS4-associated protein 1 [Mycena rosella]|uniref:VPS4-associated protein 1 n=1 Tax=Mycena rosella TaxID=1033263 RepID=A0AAD7DD47_MYCRO|nr:VPS4-associated protein 1 [Mycena rosella]